MLSPKQIAIKAALYQAGWTPGTSAREIQDVDPNFKSICDQADRYLEALGRPTSIEPLDVIEAL